MIDLSGLCYGPVYAVIGVDALFVSADETIRETIRAIDMSAGTRVGLRGEEVATFRPMVEVRGADLVEKVIAPEDLIDGTVTMNGVTWQIKSPEALGGPNGEADGLVRFFLASGDEGSA